MKYVVLSDIHANYDALKAVHGVVSNLRLTDAESTLKYWFLGDILGYGPDPVQCLRWLRYESEVDSDPNNKRWVPGNHDEEVVRLASRDLHNPIRAGNSVVEPVSMDGINGNASQSWQKHLASVQQSPLWSWFRLEVSEALATNERTQDEMRSKVVEEFGDLTLVFTHASVGKPFRRSFNLFPWIPAFETDLHELWNDHSRENRTVCLVYGHTHYPVLAELDRGEGGIRYHSIPYGRPIQLGPGCFAINPGSVGQPRDGDPRAVFAIIDTEEHTVTFHRVFYDNRSVAQRLKEYGYPQDLVEIMLTANGGAALAYYRTIYHVPRWDQTEMTWVQCPETDILHQVPHWGKLEALNSDWFSARDPI